MLHRSGSASLLHSKLNKEQGDDIVRAIGNSG